MSSHAQGACLNAPNLAIANLMAHLKETSLEQAKELITEANIEATNGQQAVNRLLFDGDHFQSGTTWIGTLSSDQTETSASLLNIEKIFVSQNVIKEIADRHVAGVLGKDPTSQVQLSEPAPDQDPSPEQNISIQEKQSQFNQWVKDKDVLNVFKEMTNEMLLSKRGILRIFIPKGFVDGGTITREDFTLSLNKIYVQFINADSGIVATDEDTREKFGMFIFEDEEENELLEKTFLEDDGLTTIEIVNDQVLTGLDLGGEITMFEVQRDAIITEQVRKQQYEINKAKTMENSNIDSGFLERIFFNAMPPGKFVKDKTKEGGEVFEPSNLKIGAATTNFFSGQEIRDSEGNITGFTNPSVHFREPIDPENFIKTIDSTYRSILHEVKQSHSQLSGDAMASGESRVQALYDFVSDLFLTKERVDIIGEWMFNTVMKLAGIISGENVEQFKIVFNSNIDPGSIPSSMATEIRAQFAEGLISRKTAMAMLGVDDIDDEIANIDTAIKDVNEVIEVLLNAGVISSTLMQELIRITMEDKAILNGLEESARNLILSEVGDSVNAQTSQRDIIGA